MNRAHVSVAKLMTTVGLVAVNLAVVHAIVAHNWVLEVGVVGTGVVLEVAVYHLLRARGGASPFATAFTWCGGIVFVSFLWAMAFPEVHGIGLTGDPVTGALNHTAHVTPGSRLWKLWNAYSEFAQAG